MHNHWDTNFKAFQSGEITLRYELTSFAGEDWAAAGRFAAEAFIPPLVIGVPEAPLGIRGQFVELEPQGVAKIFLKRAANGHGLILQTFNLTAERAKLLVGFLDRSIRAAWWCSPLEEDIESLVVEGNRVELELPSRSFVFARVLL